MNWKSLFLLPILIGLSGSVLADKQTSVSSSVPGIPTSAQGTFANRPTNPVAGQQYLATDLGTGIPIIWTGAKWKPVSGSAEIGGGFYTGAAYTGATAEINVTNVKIPGNLLSTVGMIRATAFWSTNTGTTNAKLGLMRLGAQGSTTGTAFFNFSIVSSTLNGLSALGIFSNAGATNNQKYVGTGLPSFGNSGYNNIAIDTTQDQYINFNESLVVSTDSITLGVYSVEWLEP